MPDSLFSDSSLAALYDLFSPNEGRGDFSLYFPMVMEAESVLDVGCGTGSLLHMAREAGHPGRLCGLDPAEGMLEQARKRSDIEWVQGDLSSFSRPSEFDLIVMSGHAFQVFVTDDEIRAALSKIRSALTDAGRFVFETRNPLVREWGRWIPENAREVTDRSGIVVRMAHQVELPVESDIVSFSHTFTSADWPEPRISHSSLRFLSVDSLLSFLSEAGLAIEDQWGDWDRSPLADTSPEIITVVRRG